MLLFSCLMTVNPQPKPNAAVWTALSKDSLLCYSTGRSPAKWLDLAKNVPLPDPGKPFPLISLRAPAAGSSNRPSKVLGSQVFGPLQLMAGKRGKRALAAVQAGPSPVMMPGRYFFFFFFFLSAGRVSKSGQAPRQGIVTRS